MTQIYFICQCGDKECNLGWRAINCEKSESIWQLFQSGSLHEIPEDYRKNLRAECKAIPKPCGIALFIKKIFTRWIKRDDMMTANKLLIKITDLRRNNARLNKLNRKEKYDFNRKLLPSLKQVNTYKNIYFF